MVICNSHFAAPRLTRDEESAIYFVHFRIDRQTQFQLQKKVWSETQDCYLYQISICLEYFHLSLNSVHPFVYFPSKYFRSLLINLDEIWHETLSQK